MNEPTGSETWKPIPGYEEAYEASNLGRVRSVPRTIMRSDGKPQRVRGRVLRVWESGPQGHLCVRLGGGTNQLLLHRLILLTFVGPCPEGMEGCHNNGDPTDPRLVNLRWDTKSANMQDKVRHGTNHELNKTHCPRNHPLVGRNLSPSHLKRQSRACWACIKAGNRIKTLKRNGMPLPDFQEEADRQLARIQAGILDGRAGRKMLNRRPRAA